MLKLLEADLGVLQSLSFISFLLGVQGDETVSGNVA